MLTRRSYGGREGREWRESKGERWKHQRQGREDWNFERRNDNKPKNRKWEQQRVCQPLSCSWLIDSPLVCLSNPRSFPQFDSLSSALSTHCQISKCMIRQTHNAQSFLPPFFSLIFCIFSSPKFHLLYFSIIF